MAILSITRRNIWFLHNTPPSQVVHFCYGQIKNHFCLRHAPELGGFTEGTSREAYKIGWAGPGSGLPREEGR